MPLPKSCLIPSFKVSVLTRHLKTLGGLEKYALRIAEGFTQKGAQVHIITTDRVKKNPLNPHLHFHTLSLKKWGNFRKIQEFDHLCKSWCEKKPTDLIFSMDRTRHQTHLRAGNGVHAAFIKKRENYSPFKAALNPINRVILQIEKEAFENPKLKVLFTNSHMVKREILEHYKVQPEKIQVIHNGAEWEEMQGDFDTWEERKKKLCYERNLDPSHFHFLFIGNGYRRKGLSPLLKALQLLPFKDFHLSVLGKDKHIQSFMREAANLSLSSHVSFFGQRSDVRQFYQLADTLVIPSFYDPFANVTIEALSMGLFVISSKTNGGHEILNEERGAIIPDISNPESFVLTLSKAIAHPKTWIHSQKIRKGVKNFDFSQKITTLINTSLENK